MRKVAALSVVALLALSVAALAVPSDRTVVGTITHVDTSAKSMTVKDSSGAEVTVTWNDSTKLVSGQPQEGANVTVTFDANESGSVAKSIAVQQAKKPY